MTTKGLKGPGNTPVHQYLITYFVIEINKRFERYKKYENFRVYPEYDASNNKNPDISIYIKKKPTDELLAVIEFCNSKYFKRDEEKVRTQMQNISTIQGGYVMNWQTFELFKISRLKNGSLSKIEEKQTIDEINFDISKAIERTKNDLL